MSLAVLDASVLVVFYAAEDPRHGGVVERLERGDVLFAPAHLDLEVTSALRGLARNNPALDTLVPAALAHLVDFPLRRMPLPPLLERIWELRHNITAYDAAYVALAERLDAVLITCDGRLASASGSRCAFDLIG
ncbi:type II toxin-antitoxin system VapC family toxin [Desertihabitans aurantiacus]|uniref:type II toxin-antitoxin system VapC family toxin n=1 Tax=Desertihabitans aurantiacus TaxID=2282477 RepID=UPI0018E53B72|nr:type II toxin-antitoxin system VapC family toxin [Desertihabitans aurantiacus]